MNTDVIDRPASSENLISSSLPIASFASSIIFISGSLSRTIAELGSETVSWTRTSTINARISGEAGVPAIDTSAPATCSSEL